MQHVSMSTLKIAPIAPAFITQITVSVPVVPQPTRARFDSTGVGDTSIFAPLASTQ
jgi:hypothetical protein